jgi:hypothetical protein
MNSDLRNLFRPVVTPIRTADDGLDVSADIEVAFDINSDRIGRADEVCEDTIHDVLVKDLQGPERIDVELERFQLDAQLVRNVVDLYCGEVRKIRERTDRSELRTGERNVYLLALVLVLERIQVGEIHRLGRCLFDNQTGVFQNF